MTKMHMYCIITITSLLVQMYYKQILSRNLVRHLILPEKMLLHLVLPCMHHLIWQEGVPMMPGSLLKGYVF